MHTETEKYCKYSEEARLPAHVRKEWSGALIVWVLSGLAWMG